MATRTEFVWANSGDDQWHRSAVLPPPADVQGSELFTSSDIYGLLHTTGFFLLRALHYNGRVLELEVGLPVEIRAKARV